MNLYIVIRKDGTQDMAKAFKLLKEAKDWASEINILFGGNTWSILDLSHSSPIDPVSIYSHRIINLALEPLPPAVVPE